MKRAIKLMLGAMLVTTMTGVTPSFAQLDTEAHRKYIEELEAGTARAQESLERIEKGETALEQEPEVIDLANETPSLEQEVAGSSIQLEWESANPELIPTIAGIATDEAKNYAKGKFTDFLKDNAKAKVNQVKKGAGKFFDIVDFVSPLAKVGGHLWEGDRLGAEGVLLEELSKKLCTAAGSGVLSVIPVVGTKIGDRVGEEIHNNFVKPRIQKGLQNQRDKEAQDKYLGKSAINPYLQPKSMMDADGNVRKLSAKEFYVEKGTGQIKRRSPAEQKAFEREMNIKWNDGKQINNLTNRLENDEISKEEYDKVMAHYRNRDPNKPWNTPSLSFEESETTEIEEFAEDGDGSILGYVNPVKLTAKGYSEDDMGSGDYKNIVTNTFTITFWNVGSMAPGYENASIKIKSEFSGHSDVVETTYMGVFSGGPNGTFTMNFEGETLIWKLLNGSHIIAVDVKLNVTNPDAFKNWPRNF